MSNNQSLHSAKKAKNDEFYTQLSDIEKELVHYKPHFKDMIVYCNCDDPTYSAFWRYFHLNFTELRLQKLISTHYSKTESTYKFEYTGGNDNNIEIGVKTPLQGNGDFRNQECIEILKEADIVVTNPPFSLFREYVAQLMEYGKSFLIIGRIDAVNYKEFFDYVKNNKVWAGYNGVSTFMKPNGESQTFSNIIWHTNLNHSKRHEPLILWQRYYDDQGNPLPDSAEKYPKYDNYDAINVDRVANIPCDYVPCWFSCQYAERCDWAQNNGLNNVKSFCESLATRDIEIRKCNGIMGIPSTYTLYVNPAQFKIIGYCQGTLFLEIGGKGVSNEFVIDYYKNGGTGNIVPGWSHIVLYQNGKPKIPYARVLIRRKQKEEECKKE